MSNIADFEPDGKLTPEAKEAIPSYLIKVFVPSTVTITIISCIIGYTIKDIAQKEALETTSYYPRLNVSKAECPGWLRISNWTTKIPADAGPLGRSFPHIQRDALGASAHIALFRRFRS